MAEKRKINVPENKLATAVVDGVEVQFSPDAEYHDGQVFLTDKLTQPPGSFNMRGVDNYRAALHIGPDGIAENLSVPAAVQSGSYDGKKAQGISIKSESDNFTGVMLVGGQYEIKDSKFEFISNSDGSDVSDFSGYGAAISAYSGSRLIAENVEVYTTGVARPAFFCDERSDLLILNSTATSMGGKLYDGYVNSADVRVMVAPPWVLGITGSARTTNIMGDSSSITVVNSEIKANQWGIMSTDMGHNMQMYVIDSEINCLGDEPTEIDAKNPYMRRFGSGYGSYVLGADEFFCGAHINVGTYAANLSGGNATYKSSSGLIKVVSPSTGETLYEGEGSGRVTRIESDAFGFMAHGGGSLTIIDGTQVNADDAVFLVKSGGVDIAVDSARLSSGAGVIMQMIDDDDDTVGTDFTAKYDLTFNTDFYEKAGWPSESGQITSQMDESEKRPIAPPPGGGDNSMPPPPPPPGPPGPPRDDVNLNVTNTQLRGDIFNGTGYYCGEAKQLYLNLGAGAVLDGAVSATEIIHVNEKGEQNCRFTKNEYYYLGHVKNRIFYNDGNDVEVSLSDGAVWNVTGEGVITALTVGEGCTFNGIAEMDGSRLEAKPGAPLKGIITVRPAHRD